MGKNSEIIAKAGSLLAKLGLQMKKHSPEILTGLGIGGMITAGVMAVKATPKALKLIERKKAVLKTDKLEPAKTVSTVWTCYVPSAAVCVISVLCLIGANSVSAKRRAALAAAYTLSESTLKEYQEKVVETIGEKKEEAVRDAIAKDKIDNNPVSERGVVVTGNGTTRCYDPLSGRYFNSDIDRIKKAENELNRQMRDETYISLNDFYYELGLKGIDPTIGDNIGWHIDTGYIDIAFSAQLDENQTPCLVIEHRERPKYGYRGY